jgi:anti-sigma regulatory factor (Ser/Thr protein kinase)
VAIPITADDRATTLIERHAARLGAVDHGDRRYLSLALGVEPEACGALRAVVTAFLSPTVPEDDLDDILLALDEAVANAIRHSGTRDPIRIHVRRAPHEVQITVQDAGRGFDVRSIERRWPPSLDATSGRGLYLISRLMDGAYAYSGPGTIIRMVRSVPAIA